jgi:pimeloyl-ACP methyl ester carboxylesterase/uncharacterized damage-inducible protein DinB
MDIILIPGLWLDGSSWEKVIPVLERAGHRAHPLTLPGMESKDADRAQITLRDHVDAVVAAIDSLDAAAVSALLVGHSAGVSIAYAAVDARPDRVAGVVGVGGFPAGDGDALADDYPAEGGEVPLPDWAAFDEAELAGLDEAARADFRARAMPAPERVTRDPQRLSDERRYDVPVTIICTDFTAEMLRNWIEQDLAPVRELARIRRLTLVDLAAGHWPQFTKPQDLGAAIAAAADATPQEAPFVDKHGRPEPPIGSGETATLLGYLDYQRATLQWKCRGLDAEGLRATTAASSMTLGGLLKHMAAVEEGWFSEALHGRELGPPWDAIDWKADPDWEWRSAADDSTEELTALWRDAVGRSRSLVAQALANGGLDQPAKRTWPDGRSPSLRWILCHMIEEYARHNGHADLLRESIDGETGE